MLVGINKVITTCFLGWTEGEKKTPKARLQRSTVVNEDDAFVDDIACVDVVSLSPFTSSLQCFSMFLQAVD